MKNSSKIKFILTILFFSLLIFLSVSKVYADTCECAVDGSYYCYTCSGDSYDADGNYRCDWISGSDDNAWCCWYTSWENNSPECGGGDDDDDSCTPGTCTCPNCPSGYTTTNTGITATSCPSGWTLSNGTCQKACTDNCGNCGTRTCYKHGTVNCSRCSNTYRCLRANWSYNTADYDSCEEALEGLNWEVSYSCDTSCCTTCSVHSNYLSCVISNPNQCCNYDPQPSGYYPDPCPTLYSKSCSVITDGGDPPQCPDKNWYKESCERCSANYKYTKASWNRIHYQTCQDAAGMPGTNTSYVCNCDCLNGITGGVPSGWTQADYDACVSQCTCADDCTTTCPSGFTKGSCPSGSTCEYRNATCNMLDGSGAVCDTKTETNACYKLCTGCSCTPTCPSGQSTTVSGPLCAQNLSSCTGSDSCGNSCTKTGNRCYLPETNNTPSSPSSLTMTIDGANYILDTSSSSPKVVKYPTFNNTPTISIPSRSTPSTARDLTYDFQANNEGYNNPEWTNFGCSRGEDFCIDDLSTNQTNFTPNSEPLEVVLEQGASGGVNGRYATLNKCDDNLVHSDFLSTYYVVNNLPEDPVPPEPDVGICPTITNDTLEKDQRGCNSATYTGIETNNPLKFKLSAYDEDGNDEIQGAIVWLSKEGKGNEIPDRTNISSLEDYSGSNSDHLAVMILKNGDSWDNTFVYVLDESLETWVRRDTITNTQQEEIAQIVNVEASQTTEEVIFELEVNFNEVAMDWDGEYPEGMYEINGLVFDEHMILGDFTIDQYEMLKDCRAEGSWGIDLRVPTFDEGYPEKAIKGPELLDLLWALDGTGSNLTDIVINGYGSKPSEMEDIDSDLDQGTIILESVPGTDEIGILEDPRVNSWRISSINENPHSGEIEVDMGENDRHSITMYVTGYDQACNYVLGEEIIDLNPWITTYGGMIYSGGNISGAKEIEDDQEALFEGLLEKIPTPVYQNLDVGTELVSSRGNVIGDLIRPSLGAVRASRIQDSNSKKSFWFDYLKSKLQSQIANEESGVTLQEISSPTDACVADGCYMLSEENIVIPSGYTCDKNILLMTEGNITMEPNITSAGVDTIQGCILVARGNIYIGEGEYQSQPGENLEDLGYDYIDAFMIAENQIEIELVDEDKVIRDGLEVHGGMAAFGRDLDSASSAISINRSLRLFNTFVPTVVTSWTPRYAKLSEIFFGTSAVMYKQEVGFKPY